LTEICLEIEVVFKFDILKACKDKEANKKVRVFEEMANVSVLSEKKLPLALRTLYALQKNNPAGCYDIELHLPN
jgi:hypothetical protein